jgi:long-chain acyl-CoA synthetase
MSRNIYDHFSDHAAATPGKTALVFKDQRLSYALLKTQVDTLSAHLYGIGVRKGSHIALFVNNSIEFAVLLLASAYLGATIVPMPLTLRGEYRRRALERTRCGYAVGWFSVVQQLKEENILPSLCLVALGRPVDGCHSYEVFAAEKAACPGIRHTEPDTRYILTMTSGSTGDPKPIVFSQQTKIDRAFNATKALYGLGSDDVILVATPMYHSLAQRSVLLPLMTGATAVILPKFTPGGWVDAVEREGVTFMFAVSSQLESLLKRVDLREHDVSSLQTIISSSALLKNETKLQLLEHFDCDIREIYGASEIGVATELSIVEERDKYGSVGKPLPFVTIKICDDQRGALPAGESGEIACRTSTRFLGYFGSEEATRKAFDDEEYFYTGDLGYLDEEGYLYYLGRKKELIITGGINVYPRDVEAVIAQYEDVSECAVIGVEDSYFGEAVLAVVVPVEGKPIDLLGLRRHCGRMLADYQQPLAYEIVDALPKNPMGKLMKFRLVEQFKGYTIKKVFE